MRIGFIITSPYQLFHFRRIHERFSSATAYVEVRKQTFGVTQELVSQHLPGADVIWVSSERLGKIDGECDVLLCQTPVPLMHFFSKSLTVAQQYSLAKERYQYGVWRTQANLNLMYGDYSAGRVSGFANAATVGNTLLDSAYEDGKTPGSPDSPTGRLRVLYMPTYGDLSNKNATLRRLLSQDVLLSIKLHHAEPNSLSAAKQHAVSIIGAEADPIDTILNHDVVVSDYSGAIYDALAVRRPVVVISDLNEQSDDVHRLSEEDRSRSEIGDLVGSWTGNVHFSDVYEQARNALTDERRFQRFLDRYFVNLGCASEACAHEITKLVEKGEPDNFSARQVRASNRRYILENRELRANLKAAQELVKQPFRFSDLKGSSAKVVALKAIRWGLMRAPGGDRVLEQLRRLRGAARPHIKDPQGLAESEYILPPVPRLRRQAMLTILEKALAHHGIECRTDITRSSAYCAIRDTKLDKVCKVLNELGHRFGPAKLHLWLGQGARYDSVDLAASVSVSDMIGCDSMVVGVPHQDGLYRLGRRGGAELLILERRDARLVARRWRAEKVDWTRDFERSAPASRNGNDDTDTGIGKYHALQDEPIDLVYTWVDSGDQRWQAERNKWQGKQDIESESAGNDERYLDREELRYSLRSVWLYMPFVRNIVIVTAGHVPEWLDREQQGIRVVSHDEIFPDRSALPTFNSHAIEACLHHIPDLSENFIYFNDDVFLGRETTIDHFYSKAGLIKSRFSPSSFTAVSEPHVSAIPTDWASYNAVRLISRDFDLFFDRKMMHVPMPMKRSLLQEIEERYPDIVEKTRSSRFRSQSDVSMPSMLAHYYGVATGRAVEIENKRGEYVYADTGRRDFESKLAAIGRNEPRFICLNVTRHSDIELGRQAALLQDFLRKRYPVPSPFEVTPESE